MATRKQMRQRNRTRKQNGGFLGAFAEKIASAVKEFFGKPTDGSASPASSPNAGKSAVVKPPLLSGTPKNAVVINMPPKTPPPQPSVKVTKPLTPSIAVPVGTPLPTPGSAPLTVAVPPSQSANTQVGVTTPPTIYGGKRKKNKRSKTQRKHK